MSDFLPYTEPYVPSLVRELEINLNSSKVDVIDPQTGLPTGTYLDVENVTARAMVADQEGITRWVHTAINYQELLDKNVFTSQELQTVQTWLQNVRLTVEGLLLSQE